MLICRSLLTNIIEAIRLLSLWFSDAAITMKLLGSYIGISTMIHCFYALQIQKQVLRNNLHYAGARILLRDWVAKPVD
jgi:sugar (pentulose or hexulose) kinase